MTVKMDTDYLIAMNGVGISLTEIAEHFGCHPSTVSSRLKSLGIAATDTRRSFIGDVFRSLTPLQQEWLLDRALAGQPIKGYVTQLIKLDYDRQIKSRKPNGRP